MFATSAATLALERRCWKCTCVNIQEPNLLAARFANTKLETITPYVGILCNIQVNINHHKRETHIRNNTFSSTGFRPYKCPHCSYTAIQSSSYKNHLKSRHPLSSGLFTCDLCPFKTVKNESYIQHVTDHENGLIKPNVSKKGNTRI